MFFIERKRVHSAELAMCVEDRNVSDPGIPHPGARLPLGPGSPDGSRHH